MEWVCISGSWRNSCEQLEADLRQEVTDILERGDGIVVGGAAGVDYQATEMALAHDPEGSQLQVILPTPLEIYENHFRRRAREGVIGSDQAESLITQMHRVNQLGALTPLLGFTALNEVSYYARNGEEIRVSDALTAFRVNASAGVGDTIQRARHKGIPTKVFEYTV